MIAHRYFSANVKCIPIFSLLLLPLYWSQYLAYIFFNFSVEHIDHLLSCQGLHFGNFVSLLNPKFYIHSVMVFFLPFIFELVQTTLFCILILVNVFKLVFVLLIISIRTLSISKTDGTDSTQPVPVTHKVSQLNTIFCVFSINYFSCFRSNCILGVRFFHNDHETTDICYINVGSFKHFINPRSA